MIAVTGKVYLIGAGPGDPGLLTLKAVRVLKKADAVLYDRLMNREILTLARKDAELIDVGKAPDNHPVPQHRINEILLEKALKGMTVVRLKGGDPFVFGRGSEEALYLTERGVPVEVVPGVTSAIAVPAYAGVPVTHRGISSSFHVITGSDGCGERADWDSLSRLKGTLIFLMGVKNLESIVSNLLKYGKPADTPAAMIMWGATPAQKTVTGTLADIVRRVKEAGIKNPAVFVVGGTVGLWEYLNWFEGKPLHGRRILVTGTIDAEKGQPEDGPFDFLEDAGAEVIHCPTVKIEFDYGETAGFLANAGDLNLLVFTSKNAVTAFAGAMRRMRLDLRRLGGATVAAVGRKTAERLEEVFIYPDLVPEEFTSKDLLEKIPAGGGGKRTAAVITSDIGGQELVGGLEARGYRVMKIAAYKNLPNYDVRERLIEELGKGVDAAVFTSPSSFYRMEQMVGKLPEKLKKVFIAAIGPTTAAAIEKTGLKVDVCPKEHTLEGLQKALLEKFVGRGEGDGGNKKAQEIEI
ncbi:uroporphyrinogen-III C-methyltransferase; uroporphyrinogen-III synthase [Thermosediminibacter oceani DSM 16646]|uniref:uroporphyrinogen-III C-methyltransferase n=1 Tax=Thermosediminibacter oceani (strain ATCC BAA-1034 / DSM 16646 / JW/IW-1228P) TaxID=555079 RepID=D9S0T8_THEOJ|nr:uroporphyrinogen-III C-methyltransferase; uroporphyrinogen-III synthase [Thermosediminibacter oceani DSM 16646]